MSSPSSSERTFEVQVIRFVIHLGIIHHSISSWSLVHRCFQRVHSFIYSAVFFTDAVITLDLSRPHIFQEWMTAEGLVRFMRSFQQFGVTSVETLAISKHDDVYLRFNVGIEDASELARFKQLRARAVGCTDVNNSSKSSSDSSASYASPLATDRREQLTRVSSAPARTGRRASTTGAEGVALMQVGLTLEHMLRTD